MVEYVSKKNLQRLRSHQLQPLPNKISLQQQNLCPPTLNGCFRKSWYPQIIHFNKVFHYKPSILGTTIFGNTQKDLGFVFALDAWKQISRTQCMVYLPTLFPKLPKYGKIYDTLSIWDNDSKGMIININM